MTHDLVIVGGGQAGLATAYVARNAGLAPLVLEAGDEPVGSWPSYYDSLTLFSPARFSELPGLRFGGDPDRYPTRDELAEYLRSYARALDAEIRCRTRVARVETADGELIVTTGSGEQLAARSVIAASGSFARPYRPALPGLDVFGGEQLHAADYRSPESFAGSRVVIVGGGNSAIQIAAELAQNGRVTVTTRAPLRFRPQRILGRDLHWWLTRTGVDTARFGPRLVGGGTPIIDDGRYRAALATGNPDHRPLFASLDERAVVWNDGHREPLDAVILATGYRPHLPYLASTGALDAEGMPLHRRGVSTTVPGLGYVGLEHQRSIASATVRGGARDAAYVIGAIRGARQGAAASTAAGGRAISPASRLSASR